MDANKLRHLQNIFTADNDGDLTVTYYKRSRTGATAIDGLPDARTTALSGYNKKHMVSSIDAIAKSHKFKFNFQNCTSKVNFIGWALRAFKRRDNALDITNLHEGAILKNLKTSSTQLLLTAPSTYLRTG